MVECEAPDSPLVRKECAVILRRRLELADVGSAAWRRPARSAIEALLTCSLAVVTVLAVGCGQGVKVNTSGRIQADMPPVLDRGPVLQMTVRPGSGQEHSATVAVIDVDGLLLNMDMVGFSSMGENPVNLLREKLDAAACDECIKAVVLRINSPGGAVTASDIMWREVQLFKARTNRPVVACLLDVGTGGAYYMASASDQIVAHPTSVVGGIGVILNLYNLQDTMEQFNVVGVPIRAGTNIDLGSPVKPLTEEAKGLLQAMANEYHARFKWVVSEARPTLKQAKAEVFDGRVFTASQAQEHGLIDRVGYLDDAIQAAEELAGLAPSRVVLLHRNGDPARTPYAITPNTPIQGSLLPLSIPGLDRSKLPTFLYMWQADPSTERLSGR